MGDAGFRVEIAPLARRQIRKLDRKAQQAVVDRIEQLGSAPRPAGVKKLVDTDDLYRVRVGDYRIIYQIRDRELVVLVVKVGHRRNVYS